jgi:hypothetical protein
MSALALSVGQTATGTLKFTEAGASASAPADGAVLSDNTGAATITLAPDGFTWTAVGVAIGIATTSYTGTSVSPGVGPCVVPPMVITVAAAVFAESGDFDPAGAVFT